MKNIISTLFSDYMSTQSISKDENYSKLSKFALEKEKEFEKNLTEEQSKEFSELLEIIYQIHALEVYDAFSAACKIGAKTSGEFLG